MRRGQEQGEEERDHDVEDDFAQDPQADDERRVEVEEADGDRHGDDDGGQRHPAAARIRPPTGAPGVARFFRHGDQHVSCAQMET